MSADQCFSCYWNMILSQFGNNAIYNCRQKMVSMRSELYGDADVWNAGL